MKPLPDAHVCILDYGAFIPLADMFSKVAARTSYHSPFEQEFLSLKRCCIGDGMPNFERVDDYMDPEFFDSVDLWVFPDQGFGGLQKYLRSLNRLVWGSMGASDLELYRTRFLDVLAKVGLPMVKAVRLRGVDALAEHLKAVENKHVKINRYREECETFHHIDFEHSRSELQRLAVEFGPIDPVFVVQDAIDDEEDSPVVEIGYDGWSVDGLFPSRTYSGYEAKNENYLGSEMAAEDLPEAVKLVNEKMAPVLKSYGYRNFWATEIRIKNDVAHFIDPTCRQAGMTQEHLVLGTCLNLPEVIYMGAAGEMVEPEFASQFAAEATLHYTGPGGNHGWKTLRVPDAIRDKVALYRYCEADGAYHFPPGKNDEVGVICGNGDTIEAAIEDLKEGFSEFGDEPVKIELSGFADLLTQIQTAEDQNIPFSEDGQVPGPEIALDSAAK